MTKVTWGIYLLAIGAAQYGVGVAHDEWPRWLIGLIILSFAAAMLTEAWDERNER